jgi:hypothetical protein
MAQIWKSSAHERIRYYRLLAQEVRDEAAALGNGARKSYLLIAEEWERLAAEVEQRFAN